MNIERSRDEMVLVRADKVFKSLKRLREMRKRIPGLAPALDPAIAALEEAVDSAQGR